MSLQYVPNTPEGRRRLVAYVERTAALGLPYRVNVESIGPGGYFVTVGRISGYTLPPETHRRLARTLGGY